MKTWQQFVEDVKTYAKDKEDYEKITSLQAKRSVALNKSKSNPKKFSKKSISVNNSKKEKSNALKNEYINDKNSLSLANKKNIEYKQKIKNRYKNTSGSSKALYNTTKKIANSAKNLVNRVRQRQNSN